VTGSLLSIESTLRRLASLLGPYLVGAAFPDPAEDAELQELEDYLGNRYPGSTIPPALAAMWKVWDGGPSIPGNPVPARLFYSYMFMPVRRAMHECQAIDRILAIPPSPHPADPIPSFPSGAVRDEEYSHAWLPFASDGCGGFLAVDAAPGPTGTLGQVISFGRDDRAHFQLGASILEFLDRVVNDYQHRWLHECFGDRMLYVDRLLTKQQEQGGKVWFTYRG
jgi:hypothetical protein